MNLSEFEKSLRPKEKSLLDALRENGWILYDVEQGTSWAHDATWRIRSETKEKGKQLFLNFYLHRGVHDGMDRVVASPDELTANEFYSGSPSIEFDTRGFENKLIQFIHDVDKLRCEVPT